MLGSDEHGADLVPFFVARGQFWKGSRGSLWRNTAATQYETSGVQGGPLSERIQRGLRIAERLHFARRALGAATLRATQRLERLRHPVKLDDLQRTTPISRSFGFDRGTPIDRYYIEGFLARESETIRGNLLEVADDKYSVRFGQPGSTRATLHATGEGSDGTTIIADLTSKETLPKAAFDCFICTQTFNMIFDVQRAIEGAHWLLKPGGVLLATVPGISQISRYDMDRWGEYWRFTDASLRKLFAPVFAELEIQAYGNVLAATTFLQGLAVEDLPDRSVLDVADRDYQIVLTVRARKDQ
jgi:hypothetical protein